MAFTVDEFAEKIKKEHPDYASLDNVELVDKVTAKFPQYLDQIDFEEPGVFRRSFVEQREKGLEEIQSISEATKSGEISPGSAVLQQVGAAKEAFVSPAIKATEETIAPFVDPIFEKIGSGFSKLTDITVGEDQKQAVKQLFGRLAQKGSEEFSNLSPETQGNLKALAQIGELPLEIASMLGLGALTKTAQQKVLKPGLDKLEDISKEMSKSADESAAKFKEIRKQRENTDVINKVESSVDEFLNSKKAFLNAEKGAKFKNTDLRSTLKDPEVFSGLRLENGKLNPDEAIAVLNNRLDQAMNAKRSAMPIADERLPRVSKEEIKEMALQDIPKLTPKGEKDLIARIDSEIAELDDNFTISELDDLRARFRGSAIDARGIQKADSHFAALENGTRDLIFKKMDELPGGEGSFANLNKYIKDTLNTMEFLDKNLRGSIVERGRLSKLFAQQIGAVAGSGGGVLGSITGGLAGGIISDILANRALGNTIKRQILLDLTDGTPEAIKAVDDMIKNIPDIPALPAATGEVRKEFGTGKAIELPKESMSSKEAREIERLSKDQMPK